MSMYGSDHDLHKWFEENGYPDSTIDGTFVDVAAHCLGDDVRIHLPYPAYLSTDVARQIAEAILRMADEADAGKSW
jgi:hypothetical protein